MKMPPNTAAFYPALSCADRASDEGGYDLIAPVVLRDLKTWYFFDLRLELDADLGGLPRPLDGSGVRIPPIGTRRCWRGSTSSGSRSGSRSRLTGTTVNDLRTPTVRG